ncbi:MAG: hypothetical protein OXL68_18620 [Paracoccaceae bacterium]|nr:hypothetical protein [Paracoccaceae bacterium]
MTSHSASAASALEFYDKRYAKVEPNLNRSGAKLMLGNTERPRHCRFCGEHEPAVTFKHEAHALPAAFGNTYLFSYYECDACNHLFGEGIENHLGNWSKPMRTLSRITGRNGVPTIKNHGHKKIWRIEHSDSGLRLKEYEQHFRLDEEAGRLRFDVTRDTYIPTAVRKGLIKIGLTLIPDEETRYFRETYDWIRDADHSREFVTGLPVVHTRLPGPMRNDVIVLALMRRRDDIDTAPYTFFILGFGNHLLQVFLPSVSQDKCIDGKTMAFPPFPPLNAQDPARYGWPEVSFEHLKGHYPVCGEQVPVVFEFKNMKNAKPGTASGGA